MWHGNHKKSTDLITSGIATIGLIACAKAHNEKHWFYMVWHNGIRKALVLQCLATNSKNNICFIIAFGISTLENHGFVTFDVANI